MFSKHGIRHWSWSALGRGVLAWRVTTANRMELLTLKDSEYLYACLLIIVSNQMSSLRHQCAPRRNKWFQVPGIGPHCKIEDLRQQHCYSCVGGLEPNIHKPLDAKIRSLSESRNTSTRRVPHNDSSCDKTFNEEIVVLDDACKCCTKSVDRTGYFPSGLLILEYRSSIIVRSRYSSSFISFRDASPAPSGPSPSALVAEGRFC